MATANEERAGGVVLAGTQTLERAVDVLLAVAASGNAGLSLARCTEVVGHSKPTTHRILITLAKRGLLRFDEERAVYLLGPANLRLGMDFLDTIDLRRIAVPHLRELAETTRETVHLGVIDGQDVVYIEKVDSPQPVRISSRLGRSMPLHSTSMGKALLAFHTDEYARELLGESLPARTAATIVDREVLLQGFGATRARGYAIDDEENEEGIRCCASVVFDHDGRPAASISVAGPVSRMDSAVLADFGARVRATCLAISAELGYSPSGAPNAGAATAAG